jgi:uncharacterized membrane protein YkoI
MEFASNILRKGATMKKMMTAVIGMVLTVLIVVAGASAGQSKQGTARAAHDLSGREYNTKKAGISLGDARGIAGKAFAGVIVSEELEQEHGGSGLRYSFDIRKNGVTREVGVDAVTGKVLENSLEGPGSD